jgi:hypothetical protein
MNLQTGTAKATEMRHTTVWLNNGGKQATEEVRKRQREGIKKRRRRKDQKRKETMNLQTGTEGDKEKTREKRREKEVGDEENKT